MRTTDSIIADLRKRSAATGADYRQQIIAHEQLARLRADLLLNADNPDAAAGLRAQISQYLAMVDEDVDERIVERPDRDSVDEVDGVDPVKRPRPPAPPK